MCPCVSEITAATARVQRVMATPCQGIHGKTKSLTAALLPPVDRVHWGLWDICGVKKRCLGLDLQSLQRHFSSSLQTTKHVNRPAVGTAFGPQGAQFKGKHTHTWLQDERPQAQACFAWHTCTQTNPLSWMSIQYVLPPAVKTRPWPQPRPASTTLKPPPQSQLQYYNIWTTGHLTNVNCHHLDKYSA